MKMFRNLYTKAQEMSEEKVSELKFSCMSVKDRKRDLYI